MNTVAELCAAAPVFYKIRFMNFRRPTAAFCLAASAAAPAVAADDTGDVDQLGGRRLAGPLALGAGARGALRHGQGAQQAAGGPGFG